MDKITVLIKKVKENFWYNEGECHEVHNRVEYWDGEPYFRAINHEGVIPLSKCRVLDEDETPTAP